MNNKKINNKEINALVSTEIMGYARCKNCTSGKCDTCCSYHKDYCGCIKTAWEVVEKMREEHPVSLYLSSGGSKFNHIKIHVKGKCCETACKTAPLAICLASLKAKGVNID